MSANKAIKWKKVKTDEGTLYSYVSSDTRTCLMKSDKTFEVRVNDLLSNYPAAEDIEDINDIREILEKIQNARFCVGTEEGYNCPNKLFPISGRINTLCVRCPSCRILRARHIHTLHSRDRKIKDISEEERACVVKGCPGRDTGLIRSYPIPSWDIEAWCANLKLDVSEVNENTRVCQRHFEETSINPRTAKTGARPTLNLGHNDILYQNDEVLLSTVKLRVCCIVGCTTTSPPEILFRFPRDKEVLKQWLLVCDIKKDMRKLARKSICRRHFDPSMLNKHCLKKTAVPHADEYFRKEDAWTECVVRNCPGKDSISIDLFKIPDDDIEAYCALLNLKPANITGQTRICSRHFEKKYLRTTKIKKGGRPTLNLGTKSFVPLSLEPIREAKPKFHCSIIGCDATSPPVKLFMFPANEERLKQWLSICNIKKSRNKKLLICAKHFDPTMFVKDTQRLKRDAVPNMELSVTVENFNDSSLSCTEDNLNETNFSDDDSDVFEGLECKSTCRTCVKVFKDCEIYRKHFFALEDAVREEQENIEALRKQNEQLMSELESRMTSL